MASQIELETQVAFLSSELDSYRLQLLSATTPEDYASIQSLINTVSDQLTAATFELNNITEANALTPLEDPVTFADYDIPPAVDSTVPDGADPFVNDGISTIDPLDDGSDPYVSNGGSTIVEPVTYADYDIPPDTGISDPELEAEPIEWSEPPVIDEEPDLEAADRIESEDPTINSDASNSTGLPGQVTNTRQQATDQDQVQFQQKADWRVRLSLAPGANYLYKNKGKEGILKPLAATDGVVFPYTPAISVSYAAGYDTTEVTHSNYKIYQYKSSSVDTISITCDFTAQDTQEANYLLAVIHFFRSVTKMFYGQDSNPAAGTPPPLCYLSGLGSFQFDSHPLVVTQFNYSLPTDCDYIRTGAATTIAGTNLSGYNSPTASTSTSTNRIESAGLTAGAMPAPPQFNSATNIKPTYVPTKMQIQITCLPIVTRNDISNKFSLDAYGTGLLLQGTQRSGGGIW